LFSVNPNMKKNTVRNTDQHTVLDFRMANEDIGIQFRKSRSGPEEELVSLFLQRLKLKLHSGLSVTFFKEPRLESGFPDIVGVIWHKATAEKWNDSRKLLQNFDLRLMHYLSQHGTANVEFLQQIFGKNVKDSIDKLEASDMVRYKGVNVKSRPLSKLYATKHIFAIEAKINHWQTALNQAFLNRWFATSSYVLFPNTPSSKKLFSKAESFGVRVWNPNQNFLDSDYFSFDNLPESYGSLTSGLGKQKIVHLNHMQNQNPLWVAQAFPNLQNINLLGQGGQKTVFSALHPDDGEVVLKIIHPSQNVEDIRREILAVETIATNRVPQILETGQMNTIMGNSVWIRENRIDGISLRERLQRGSLSLPELFGLGVQILEPLACAEESQIVHRDVKPENIMVDRTGDFWLLDFGISRHLAMPPLTPMTSPFGKFTLGYAPPEQIRNIQNEIDATADLFAFGVTFYESAFGSNPFTHGATDVFEVLRRIDNYILPPLNLPCNNSRSLSDLISAITQKRRDHRPKTVAEVLEWMQEIADAQ
jgi:eukaryotic-like serine/threonine-protein kinase